MVWGLWTDFWKSLKAAQNCMRPGSTETARSSMENKNHTSDKARSFGKMGAGVELERRLSVGLWLVCMFPYYFRTGPQSSRSPSKKEIEVYNSITNHL